MKKLLSSMLLLIFLCTATPVTHAENLSNTANGTKLMLNSSTATTGSPNTTSTASSISSQKVPAPLFDGTENALCVKKGNTITCKEKLFMGVCELFSLGIKDADVKTYACAAYPDPLPADAVNNTPSTLCIVVDRTKENSTEIKYSTVDEARKSAYKYCDAIAVKTGGGLELLFNFISYIFFIVQPLLISVAVVYIITIGLQIMYAGGSPEDVQKKIKEKLINVLSGLTLLFLIKLILVTINGAFFVNM